MERGNLRRERERIMEKMKMRSGHCARLKRRGGDNKLYLG